MFCKKQNICIWDLEQINTYLNKYIAEITAVVAGSSKLFGSTPYAFSPGIGAGWILSEENFLSDNKIIDYLKIKANWALNHNDENIDYYLYMSNYYSQGSSWRYNQGNTQNNSRTAFLGNPNLCWEKTMELNLGFESELFNKKLSVEGIYFYNLASDLITTRSNYYPAYYNLSIYENYGKEQYQGVEMGLNLTEKFGDFKFSFGTNFVYSVPKTLQIDELNYDEKYEYLKKTGKPSDAMFGYVALSLYKDQEDIDNSPQQVFGIVRPGDIKYQDINEDGIIDELDRKMIGNSKARLGYGLHLNIKYKALELFAIGNGQAGGNVYFNNAYYWVYGDRKYSEVVLNRWAYDPIQGIDTRENATYPRLTTNESNNNFRNSTYWIYKNNWLRLQTVQLTYSLPPNTGILKETRFFVRANNLLTISKIKDKLDLNVDKAPRLRQFSFGVNASF